MMAELFLALSNRAKAVHSYAFRGLDQPLAQQTPPPIEIETVSSAIRTHSHSDR